MGGGRKLADNEMTPVNKFETDNVKVEKPSRKVSHDIESTMMGSELLPEESYLSKPNAMIGPPFKTLPSVPALKGSSSPLAHPRKPLLERLAHSRKAWKPQNPKKRERKISADLF